MHRIKLKVTIRLLTPLHVGADDGEEANISYILRDVKGDAYYSGTAFKGKVRHYAHSLQKDSCIFPESCNCTVCRLFGGEGNSRGSLFFENFYAVGQQLKELRVGNAIDRFRRVADDKKLFTVEAASIRELSGYITGNIQIDDIKLLEQSIKLVKQIGGNTSRGFGWLDGEILLEWERLEEEENDDERLELKEIGTSFADSIRLVLTPKSPLLIGTHTTQSNFRDSQHVIPGAVIRAAMARAICEYDGTSDPSPEGIRDDLPKDRLTRFPYLRKSFGNLRFSTLNSIVQPWPLPMTMRRCKFHKEHQQADMLAAMLRGDDEVCPECNGRLDKIEVFRELPTVTSVHSGIDKYRGTTSDEHLYTIRAIAPDKAVFSGIISGGLDLTELSQLLEPSLRVGAMITKGFGECQVQFEALKEAAEPEQDLQDMANRIKEFNKLVGRREVFVPITLLSDAFVNLEEPEDGNYCKAYSCLTDPFEVVRVIAKNRIWRGFDTGKKDGKFQKDAQLMLKAGSVLVIRTDALDPEIIQKLGELASKGIGMRTEDGYGSVCIVHDYHIKS